MGKFVVIRRRNGEFQFDLKAGNGQTILTSEGYYSKAACENGIDSVVRNSQDLDRFDRRESSNGQPYFYLTATNGQIIGRSTMYETISSRDHGIESVKKNAVEAVLEFDLD